MDLSEKILEERRSEYGSFTDNIDNIGEFHYSIHTIAESKKGFERRVMTITNFIPYMLALKAARSIYPGIPKERYTDCVVDFINYYKIYIKHLNLWCDDYNVFFSSPFNFKTLDINNENLVEDLIDKGMKCRR